jgi:hypothetical protein
MDPPLPPSRPPRADTAIHTDPVQHRAKGAVQLRSHRCIIFVYAFGGEGVAPLSAEDGALAKLGDLKRRLSTCMI